MTTLGTILLDVAVGALGVKAKAREKEDWSGQTREGGVKNRGDGEVGLVAGHIDSTLDNEEDRLLEMKVREGSEREPQIVMVAVIAGAGRDPQRATSNDIGKRVLLGIQRSQKTRMRYLRSKHH